MERTAVVPGPKLHFLHIGKTGGTAIAEANATSALHPLIIHPHGRTLRDIPPGEPVFFVARDPCDRFVSGFNSRLRKGLPRFRVEWSAAEMQAFGRFATADTLARALSDVDPATRAAAAAAMQAIKHTARRLSFWLGSAHDLAGRRGDIAFIADFRQLAGDLALLSQLLRLPQPLALPSDPVSAHRTPAGFDTSLSELGRANVQTWYRSDIALHEACLAMRSCLIARALAT